MINLDFVCMKYSVKIQEIGARHPKDIENVINKSLGVLTEDGLYAFFLFLFAHKKGASKDLIENIVGFITDDSISNITMAVKKELDAKKHKTVFDWLLKLSENLDKTILVKELVQKLMTYSRYNAKIIEKPTPGKKDQKVAENKL